MFDDVNARAAAVAVPLFYGLVEALAIAIYCVWAWKVGWTKAPKDENICVVITKTYEVSDGDDDYLDGMEHGDVELDVDGQVVVSPPPPPRSRLSSYDSTSHASEAFENDIEEQRDVDGDKEGASPEPPSSRRGGFWARFLPSRWASSRTSSTAGTADSLRGSADGDDFDINALECSKKSGSQRKRLATETTTDTSMSAPSSSSSRTASEPVTPLPPVSIRESSITSSTNAPDNDVEDALSESNFDGDDLEEAVTSAR